jgi:membrane-associated phospholipid phosphatase
VTGIGASLLKRAAALIALLAAIGPGPALRAQDDRPPAADRLNGAYVRQAGADILSVLKAPASWTGRDWLTFGAVAGAGVVLALNERKIRDWTLDHRTDSSLKASDYISPLGKGGTLIAGLAGLYLAGEAFDEPGLRRTSLLALESFAATSVFVLSLKTVVGRARPRAGEGNSSFHPFSIGSTFVSFPSGDAAGAWSVATVIADRTDGWPVDVLCYGMAGLVTAWRVHDDKHWASDAFVGAALGYFTAKKICRLHGNPKGPDLRAGVSWLGGYPAASLVISF